MYFYPSEPISDGTTKITERSLGESLNQPFFGHAVGHDVLFTYDIIFTVNKMLCTLLSLCYNAILKIKLNV